jgi:hypothetical protein
MAKNGRLKIAALEVDALFGVKWGVNRRRKIFAQRLDCRR